MNRADRRKYAKNINTPAKLQSYSRHLDTKLRQEYQKAYEEKYKEDLGNSIDIFILAIIYTLHYNEKCNFGNARIKDFMEDLFVTVDYFRTGEYDPEDYRKKLLEEGINVLKSKDIKKGNK